jgi:hypothetical protein
MFWDRLKQMLEPRVEHATAPFTVPPVIFEVQRDFVLGSRLNGHGRGARRLAAVAARSLDEAALEPHLHHANVMNLESVRGAVSGVAAVVADGANRFGLVIPDAAVRVAVFKFETLPESGREAEALVLWRMRSGLPFSPQEARVTYQVLSRDESGVEVLAVAGRHAVLAEYEATLEPVNGGPALVVPATVCLLPLVPEEVFGQLLVHICSGSMTSVLVAGRRVGLWRTREVGKVGNLGTEVAAEAARTIASAGDHLGVAVERVWLCVRPPASEDLLAAVAGAAACEVRPLETSEPPGSALSSEARLTYMHFGAPLAGLVAPAG